MFQRQELKRLSPLLFFWAGYTLLFFLWVKTFLYTLPFVLGLGIAVAVQPIIQFFDRRFHWNHTVSTAVVTACVLGAFFFLLGFLGILAVREITAFLVRVSEDGFSEFSQPMAELFNKIGKYLQKLDLNLLEQNQQEIMSLLQNSMDIIIGFLRTVLGLLTSLPTILTMVIVTIFAAFFIARDLEHLRSWIKQLFSSSILSHVKDARNHSEGLGRKYLASYLLLYFITFCESGIIFYLLGISYPLTTALITAAADLLPVLGPGFVFLPLLLYQLLTGQYATAAGLLIGWGIISLVRQVTEPKLISSTMKIHPLSMLAAIYFSLVGKSIWILFYVMFFFLLYSVFRNTGALPALTEKEPSCNQEGSQSS